MSYPPLVLHDGIILVGLYNTIMGIVEKTFDLG